MRPSRYPAYVPARSDLPEIGPEHAAGWRSPVSVRERIFWLAAVLVLLALLVLMSWLSQRDERNDRLYHSLATARCPAPNPPLQNFLLSIASDADGGAPTLTCVYITGELGAIPKLRYAKPLYAQARF